MKIQDYGDWTCAIIKDKPCSECEAWLIGHQHFDLKNPEYPYEGYEHLTNKKFIRKEGRTRRLHGNRTTIPEFELVSTLQLK